MASIRPSSSIDEHDGARDHGCNRRHFSSVHCSRPNGTNLSRPGLALAAATAFGWSVPRWWWGCASSARWRCWWDCSASSYARARDASNARNVIAARLDADRRDREAAQLLDQLGQPASSFGTEEHCSSGNTMTSSCSSRLWPAIRAEGICACRYGNCDHGQSRHRHVRAEFYLREFESSAAALAVEPDTAVVRNRSDIEKVIVALGQRPNSALVVAPDGVHAGV